MTVLELLAAIAHADEGSTSTVYVAWERHNRGAVSGVRGWRRCYACEESGGTGTGEACWAIRRRPSGKVLAFVWLCDSCEDHFIAASPNRRRP